jgi:hypothetical protein
MNEIRRWRGAAFAIILAAIAATTAGAADDEKVRLDQFAAAAKAVMSATCDGYRHDEAVAASAPAAGASQASAERIIVQETTKMTCGCMPQAIDAYVAAQGGDTLMARADAGTRLQAATASCTARGLRNSTEALCAAGLDPFAKRGSAPIPGDRQRARCTCMQAGTARLTDQQIADSAMASYRDYAARAKARAQGASEPAPSPNAMRDLEQTCRAQDAAH